MLVRPTFVVLDGTTSMMTNGPTGGSLADLKATHTLVVSTDPVAADAFGATLLGKTFRDLPYLVRARRRSAAGRRTSRRSIRPRARPTPDHENHDRTPHRADLLSRAFAGWPRRHGRHRLDAVARLADRMVPAARSAGRDGHGAHDAFAATRGLRWALATIALTILFGRVFCGFVCPFGAIHQFVGWLGQRGRRPEATGWTRTLPARAGRQVLPSSSRCSAAARCPAGRLVRWRRCRPGCSTRFRSLHRASTSSCFRSPTWRSGNGFPAGRFCIGRGPDRRAFPRLRAAESRGAALLLPIHLPARGAPRRPRAPRAVEHRQDRREVQRVRRCATSIARAPATPWARSA